MLLPGMQNLEPPMRTMAQAELKSDERLVWAAQPTPRFFTIATIVPVLFAIPWTGFAIFWTSMAFIGTHSIRGHDPMTKGFQYFFPLFGLPFILIGLGMLSSPFWMVRGMKRTVYMITDQRAVIMKPGFFGSRKVDSFEPSRLTAMERLERRDGSGDLIFEQFTTRRGSGTQTTRRGFISVPRVREVEDILRKSLLQDRTRAM